MLFSPIQRVLAEFSYCLKTYPSVSSLRLEEGKKISIRSVLHYKTNGHLDGDTPDQLQNVLVLIQTFHNQNLLDESVHVKLSSSLYNVSSALYSI